MAAEYHGTVRLVDLKTQALRYLALGEPEKALLVYRGILLQVPTDLDSRMRVADVLAQIGQHHLACRVYAAVAWCDLQAGRPLHALVCSQALSDLGQSVESLHESLAELYGAGSLRLRTPLLVADDDGEAEDTREGDEGDGADEDGAAPREEESYLAATLRALEGADERGAPRLAFGAGSAGHTPEEMELEELSHGRSGSGEAASTGALRSWSDVVGLTRSQSGMNRLPRDGGLAYANHLFIGHGRGEDAPLLPGPDTEVAEGGLLNLALDRAAEATAEVAAEVRSFTSFPAAFAPVPVLSALRGEAFVRISQAARIRRVGPREVLTKEGAQGGTVLLLASGAVQLFRERPGKRSIIGTLGEGAVLGDLGLVAARAAALGVETTEPTDLVEIPIRALRTLAAEDPAAARALERYTNERLIGALLLSGPLFRPLPLRQRRVLMQRFQVFRVAAEQVLLREGERMEGLCLLLSGTVEVLRGQEPFEEVAGHLHAGMVCGETALLRAVAAPWTLRATTAATVLFLPREAFERALQGSSEARAYLYGLSAGLLRELSGVGRDVLPRAGAPLALSVDGGDGDDLSDSADRLFHV